MTRQYAISPVGGNWGEVLEHYDTLADCAENAVALVEAARRNEDLDGVTKLYLFSMVADAQGFWGIDPDSDPFDALYIDAKEDAEIITQHCPAVEKVLKARAKAARAEARYNKKWGL